MIAKNKERITITLEKSIVLFAREKSTILECTLSEYVNDIIKKEVNSNGKKTI